MPQLLLHHRLFSGDIGVQTQVFIHYFGNKIEPVNVDSRNSKRQLYLVRYQIIVHILYCLVNMS